MFFTARQLEILLRESGSAGFVVLPYRARLTPAAQDWVRLKKLTIGYSEETFRGAAATIATADVSPAGAKPESAGGTLLWWCEGPCGAAKAAITAQERESVLRAIAMPSDVKQLVPAVKQIAREIKAGSAASAVLMVKSAASAILFANRCPSLRAVVGTCQDSVEQAIQQVAANVLVIEHPYKTLQQMRNMLARFARAKRELNPEVQRQLAELASCA